MHRGQRLHCMRVDLRRGLGIARLTPKEEWKRHRHAHGGVRGARLKTKEEVSKQKNKNNRYVHAVNTTLVDRNRVIIYIRKCIITSVTAPQSRLNQIG